MSYPRGPLSVEDREQIAIGLHRALEQRLPDTVRLPNLVGVGSARCGTTFLYGLLRGQANVYVTPVKETNYFAIASRRRMTAREYALLFMGQGEQPYVADLTPTYMHQPGALEEIASTLGKPRIVFNLREPVSRLVSHYKFDAARHGCADLQAYLAAGLQEGLRAKSWTSPGRAILLSLYAEPIERAYDLFGRENCCILSYDDLDPDGARWIAQLTAFLGVDLAPTIPEARFRNATGKAPVAWPETTEGQEVLALFEADAARLRGLIGPGLPDLWHRLRRS